MESADSNADVVWPQVGIPEHCRSACWAEVLSELSSLLPIADIDFGRPFGVNMLPLEVGTHAKHRAGSPLTLATMASDDSIRIGGYFDTQGTARAMRGSRHGTPPSSGAARLQEGGRQSDPFAADRAQLCAGTTVLPVPSTHTMRPRSADWMAIRLVPRRGIGSSG